MSRLTGFDIITNDATVPLFREVTARDWHRRRAYASRVNKKWKKRFGVIGHGPLIKDGDYIQFGRTLVMSSKTLEFLKRKIQESGR